MKHGFECKSVKDSNEIQKLWFQGQSADIKIPVALLWGQTSVVSHTLKVFI